MGTDGASVAILKKKSWRLYILGIYCVFRIVEARLQSSIFAFETRLVYRLFWHRSLVILFNACEVQSPFSFFKNTVAEFPSRNWVKARTSVKTASFRAEMKSGLSQTRKVASHYFAIFGPYFSNIFNLLRPAIHLIFQNSFPTSQGTKCISTTKTNRLMLFKKIIDIYCTNQMKRINILMDKM
jgi:hypothetical protein